MVCGNNDFLHHFVHATTCSARDLRPQLHECDCHALCITDSVNFWNTPVSDVKQAIKRHFWAFWTNDHSPRKVPKFLDSGQSFPSLSLFHFPLISSLKPTFFTNPPTPVDRSHYCGQHSLVTYRYTKRSEMADDWRTDRTYGGRRTALRPQ